MFKIKLNNVKKFEKVRLSGKKIFLDEMRWGMFGHILCTTTTTMANIAS